MIFHDCIVGWAAGAQLVLAVFLGVAGAFLLIGLLTPAASLLAGALELWAAIASGWPAWPSSILLISVLISLAALGPGAYSLDGRLFGRKKINIARSDS